MDLCEFCEHFIHSICEVLHQQTYKFPEVSKPFTPFKELSHRSRHCRFCRLVNHHAAKALNDPTRRFLATHQAIFCPTRISTELPGDHLAEIPIEIWPQSRGPWPDKVTLHIAIWADPGHYPYQPLNILVPFLTLIGSPAAGPGLMNCNPPLPSDSCPEALTLFQNWFESCCKSHVCCGRTLSNSLIDEDVGPQLPTRVLDLGPPGDIDLVLVETNGSVRGNYCALSYCWGPAGAQTCITTKKNRTQRLRGIALDSMPKVFRDAVQIARHISMRYLWIDGLCIVQGDTEDWERESKQMGSIYEKASLVIAASGARSPEDGCFVSTPRELSTVDLPFYSGTGRRAGSFHACVWSSDPLSPEHGPLWERGWALQESYLARRLLHFMPGGPSWVCNFNRGFARSERDTTMYVDGRPEWGDLVERFSRKRLTKKSDRLMALEGIATELQNATGDTYNRGIFLSEFFTHHLLWANDGTAPESEDLSDVPSWSWASIGGPKNFTSPYSVVGSAEWKPDINQTEVCINAHGHLRLWGIVLECNAYNAAALDDDRRCDLTNRFLHRLMSVKSTQALFYIHGPSLRCNGFAVFDRQNFESVCFVSLASNVLERLLNDL